METKKQNNADIKRVQSELLKYLRNETNSIPHSLKLLTNIDLSNSSLVELKGGIFNGFDSLHEINISNNQLTSLPHNLFDGLKNIDFINFSNNHIRELPSNLFSSVKTLVRINFSHNNIESLPDNLFNGLSKLDSVNFSYNSLKTLPGVLFNGLVLTNGGQNEVDYIHLINFCSTRLVFYQTISFTIFKNLAEITNYPLCVLTIVLDFGEAKSVLYSITIILSYVIRIMRLDKFYEIGPCITVFGNVIVRSLRLIAILVICIIGFLLSFRNRANYDFGANPDFSNNMQLFNTTFELSLFRIFMLTAGQVTADGMGIEVFNWHNFINYFILVLFIIIMPILFMNVFTGISIDEISTLIERSEADNIATKIEYVHNIESLKHLASIHLFITIFQLKV